MSLCKDCKEKMSCERCGKKESARYYRLSHKDRPGLLVWVCAVCMAILTQPEEEER